MKSKKRHQTSSEESEMSEGSEKSSSSSDSESEDSFVLESRHKKKRKRADSSDSLSDSGDQKKSKKRKHKKKKKKHGKKKRRTDSPQRSESEGEASSMSEGEISPKKKRKHKHKHSKRARSPSGSEEEEKRVSGRLHSVVKERRSSLDDNQPPRTYYQKEYYPAESGNYEREREVQRFYRGSSKERKYQEHGHYKYDREHNDRYAAYHQEKYGESAQYRIEDYNRKQREYHEYKRVKYEDRRPEDDYRKREEVYHARDGPKEYNKYNHYEDRGPKKRDYDGGREYKERRAAPEHDRYKDREFEKREKYQDDGYSDRPREVKRERPDRPPAPSHHREPSKSPEERYRERRRGDVRGEGRGEDRRDRPRDDRPPRVDGKPPRKSRFTTGEDGKEYSWGKATDKEDEKPQGEKEKPNFGLSGKLTADANTVNGVVIKYTEPDDAKQPKRRWRFYPFKGDKALPILYIHRQSAFLIGRDKKVADICLEHPSISKQHAALQFRATPFTRPDGSQGRRVRPYIIDLESANGTFVNNKKIEARRYVELLERDVVKFGFSQREFVLLHENSKDDAQDDDQEAPGVTTTEVIKQDKRIKQEVAEDGE